MLNLNSFLLSSENPQELADFYQNIFQVEPNWNEGGYTGFQIGSCAIAIGPHDKVKGKNPNPERIILNLETKNFEEDFKRIKELGVKVIAEPYNPGEAEGMTICTFEDPDGNYFQLATPFEA